jgi:hypothetical protein
MLTAGWNAAKSEFHFDIVPTAVSDPALTSSMPGGPQMATYQWHRTTWFDSEEDY